MGNATVLRKLHGSFVFILFQQSQGCRKGTFDDTKITRGYPLTFPKIWKIFLDLLLSLSSCATPVMPDNNTNEEGGTRAVLPRDTNAANGEGSSSSSSAAPPAPPPAPAPLNRGSPPPAATPNKGSPPAAASKRKTPLKEDVRASIYRLACFKKISNILSGSLSFLSLCVFVFSPLFFLGRRVGEGEAR